MSHHRRPLGRAFPLLLLSAALLLSGVFAAASVAAPAQSQFAMGDTFSMLIKPDGTLWAWGNNQYGQLGLNVSSSARPAQVGSEDDWAEVATGSVHTLARKTDGTLWSWGYNLYGQLGLGDLVNRVAPTQVGTDSDWIAVAAGLRFSFALKSDGSLWAWGQNDQGQLGVGDTDQRAVPTRVGMHSDWDQVDGGGQHAAAVKSNGTMWSWGRNHRYQLGLDDTTSRLVPTQIGTADDWASVGCSDNDCRALTRAGALWAWGYNNFGQLGLGDTVTRQVPTEVGGSWGPMILGDDSAYAIKPDGTLWAWGDNTYGQLGQGDTDYRDEPAAVGSDSDWVVVGSGHDHAGAVKSDGSLWMWGKNGALQLGLGDTTHRSLPVPAFYVEDYAAPPIDSLTSSTHPDTSTLYADAYPSFSWVAGPDQSGAVMYSKDFDRNPGTTPKPVADTTLTEWTSPLARADGTWYFHVRAGDAAGNWGPAAHRRVMIDATPPVTSADAPAGWSKDDVAVHLTATDGDGSGVAGTEYRLDGGAWTPGATVTVSGNGVHVLAYRSTDNLGTVEAVKNATVRIDTVAPVTTDDAPGAWSKSVTVHLTATDAGSGVAGTEYKLDGGAWTAGTSVKVSGDGVHTLAYRSTDNLGTIEADQSATVRIDAKRPTTAAPRSAKVRRGRYVRVYYKVNDARPGSPTATVKIKIKTLGGKTVKQITLRNRKVNSTSSYRFRCKFPKRTYRYYVYATDSAGNIQSKVGRNLLRVR